MNNDILERATDLETKNMKSDVIYFDTHLFNHILAGLMIILRAFVASVNNVKYFWTKVQCQ